MQRLRNEIGRFESSPSCYERLLEYECVQEFLSMIQSEKTRDDYMRYLHVLAQDSGLSPDDLLKLDEDEARKVLMKCVRGYLREGKNTAARLMQTAVKSFYECNGKTIKLLRADRVKKIKKKVAFEYVPTKEDIYRMGDAFSRSNKRELRNRAIILCLFHSGVRVGCLINWKIGMVKNQLYPDIKVPVKLRITNEVDTKLNGYGLGYYVTFLGTEAAMALKRYLDFRQKDGGKLNDSDYIFKPIMNNSNKESTNKDRIQEVIKLATKEVGLDPKSVWTHQLRKSFRKVLNASQIDEDTKEVLMGHNLPGSRGNYFDYHDIDEIAAKYVSADFSLHSPEARLTKLEEEKMKLERELKEKTGSIEGLMKRIGDLESIYMEKVRIKK